MPDSDPTHLAITYQGPLLVTVAYLLLYYVIQLYGLFLKIRLHKEYAARGEKFDRYFGQDRIMLAADRMQMNTLEHMPAFLILMWLTAAFVDVGNATVGGLIYFGARCAYPLVVGKRLGRGTPMRIFPITFLGYGVLAYFCVVLVAQAL